MIPSKPYGECYPHSWDNSKRADEVRQVNHPLTCDQEFLFFFFASGKNDNPEVNEPSVANREVILEQVADKGLLVICIRSVHLFTESFVSVFYLIIRRLVNY